MRKLRFVIGVGVALSFAACSNGSPTRTARWSPFASVTAVVDMTDARARDGRLTVAAAGRLSLLGPSGTPVPYARGPHGYSTRTNEPYIARADDRAVPGAGCSFVEDTIYALEPSNQPAVIR